MKFPLLIVVFLIAVASVSAAPVYWTVFDDAGAASDVVNGANFAASMKASAGVSFSGKTESQVATSGQNMEDAFIARFDGKNVEISYGSNSAFADVVDVARTYLRDQGFSVTVREYDEHNTNAPTRSPPSAPSKEEETAGDASPIESGAEAVIPEPIAVLPQEEPVAQDATEQEEEHGFFGRIWRWFADLFS